MRISRVLLIAAFFAAFVGAGLLMRSLTRGMGVGDSEHYLAIANDPGTFTTSPWGYRIAVPYSAALISSLFHTGIPRVFRFIQFLLYGAILTTMLCWFRYGLRAAWSAGLAACCLFIFSYNGVYNLHNTAHVGFAELFLLLLGVIALYHRRFLFLAAIIFVACFVKESIPLILIPAFFVLDLFDEPWRRAVGKTCLLGLLFLIPSLFLRSGILFHGSGGLGTYSSFYTWDYVRFVYTYYGGIPGAVIRMAKTFGPVWLIALAGLSGAPARLKLLSGAIIALATAQIALATDVYRMVGCAFPVVLALACLECSRIRRIWLPVLVGVNAVYFFILNNNIDSDAALYYILPAALALVLFIHFSPELKSGRPGLAQKS